MDKPTTFQSNSALLVARDPLFSNHSILMFLILSINIFMSFQMNLKRLLINGQIRNSSLDTTTNYTSWVFYFCCDSWCSAGCSIYQSGRRVSQEVWWSDSVHARCLHFIRGLDSPRRIEQLTLIRISIVRIPSVPTSLAPSTNRATGKYHAHYR